MTARILSIDINLIDLNFQILKKNFYYSMSKLIAFRAYEFDTKVIYATVDNFITDLWLTFGYVDFIIDQWQSAHEKVNGRKRK